MTLKFYRCRSCGQIVSVVKDTKLPIVCCGAEMEEIKAGTVDAMPEKHVPIYEKKGKVSTNGFPGFFACRCSCACGQFTCDASTNSRTNRASH